MKISTKIIYSTLIISALSFASCTMGDLEEILFGSGSGGGTGTTTGGETGGGSGTTTGGETGGGSGTTTGGETGGGSGTTTGGETGGGSGTTTGGGETGGGSGTTTGGETGGGSETTDTTAFKIQTLTPDEDGVVIFTYEGGEKAFELPSTVKKVVIKSTESKTASTYFAKMNDSLNSDLSNEDTRYIVGSGSTSSNQMEFNIQENPNELNKIMWNEDPNEVKALLATLPKVPQIATPSASRSASRTAVSVGSTKELYFGVSGGYEKRAATLRATGTNCNVWVIDSEYDNGTKTKVNPYKYITTKKAQDMADKFDEIYGIIRTVYGEESNLIYMDKNVCNMADACDTGTKVNIVLGDLDEDASDSVNSYRTGYFYSADYIGSSYCNYGKYLYIDSYVFNKWGNSAYETAAHEFQHMINFANNYWNPWTNGNYSDADYSQSWFNEMMSCIAEDMMQTYFNTADSASSKTRIKNQFLTSYTSYGTTTWKGDLGSYASVYAYGAFLVRNYGGAKLINKISTSDKHNNEAITDGLKQMGYDETFESVWKKLPIAFTFKTASLSLTKDAPTNLTYSANGKSYNFPMTAFPESYLSAKIYGTSKSECTAIGNYKTNGFSMHKLTSTTNSTITISPENSYEITFDTISGDEGDQNEKLVFYMAEK